MEMNPFWTILIIVLAMIYIISPIDGIPDMIPVLGWLDDTFLIGLLIYYLRYRRLPGFLARLGQWLFSNTDQAYRESAQSSSESENSEKPWGEAASDPRSPWEILGVKPGASQDEIHRAYRKAVQQYHPDKVSHLGKEFQELAQKKFVEIQEAYHILTQ